MATEARPTRTITTSAAYQFTGICPRYVAPPPVAAARATDFPEELLAMAGGNPTAWLVPLPSQASPREAPDRGWSSRGGGPPTRSPTARPEGAPIPRWPRRAVGPSRPAA